MLYPQQKLFLATLARDAINDLNGKVMQMRLEGRSDISIDLVAAHDELRRKILLPHITNLVGNPHDARLFVCNFGAKNNTAADPKLFSVVPDGDLATYIEALLYGRFTHWQKCGDIKGLWLKCTSHFQINVNEESDHRRYVLLPDARVDIPDFNEHNITLPQSILIWRDLADLQYRASNWRTDWILGENRMLRHEAGHPLQQLTN